MLVAVSQAVALYPSAKPPQVFQPVGGAARVAVQRVRAAARRIIAFETVFYETTMAKRWQTL